MRDDTVRLKDILNSIEKIEQQVQKGKDAFLKDELLQTWFVYHIQIIGEAARALSEELRNNHSEVPWKDIIGMRHFIVHQYTDIDLETVWEVVKKDIPNLKNKIQRILAD